MNDRTDDRARAGIRVFRPEDEAAVVALWARCGLLRPWNDPHRDIERRLAIADGLFLVVDSPESGPDDTGGASDSGDTGGTGDTHGRGLSAGIVASAMGGHDGHRGWVYYVAVDPGQRGRGTGRRLMAELEHRLLARGCPKINLQVRDGNTAALAFYARLGFSADRTTSLGKRLIPDD